MGVSTTGAGGVVNKTIDEKTDGTTNDLDAANKKASDEAAPAAGGAGGCSLLSFSGIGTCIVEAVGTVILSIANLLLGISGTLLNWVVVKTVFEFGSLIGNSPGVLIAWGIFRDIGNLILLFGFIFMGLAMILNLNTFSAQKAIPRLLVFAVLMNFSLFAAEAVIDVTNALSSVMYSQANTDFCLKDVAGVPVTAHGNGGNQQDDAAAVDALSDCAVNYGLAGHIMQSTGLSTLWKVNSAGFSATAVTFIGLALFATIGAVVLLAAAIMLSIRLIVLSFLMVTSPIGFAGMAIPPMQRFARMWWDKLISNAIFAPVLFLLIFVSLKITDSFAINSERSLAGALTQPNASVMGIIMIFVIVIGFLIASLIAARSIGAQGATGAINFAGKFAGGKVIGATGFLGRQTAGRGSAAVARQIRGSRLGETELGRRLAGVADKGAKASFDVRGTKAFKGAAKAAKIDFGEAQKGGIKKEIEDTKKARTEYAKTLKGRRETEEEYTKRLADLRAEVEKKAMETQKAKEASANASKNTDERLKEANDAQSELDSAKAARPALELQLERLQRQADRDPGNADLKQQLRAQQKSIDDIKAKERDAEQKLAEATNRLAEARRQESAAREAETKAIESESKAIEAETKAHSDGRREVSAKVQQEGYATNLENSLAATTLRGIRPVTGRANQEAAKAIREEAKKSKKDKLLEEVKKKLDEGDKKGAKEKLEESEKESDEEGKH